MRVSCSANGQQQLKINYTVSKDYTFSAVNAETPEVFDEMIAVAIINNADGEITDWNIISSDTDTTLHVDHVYHIVVSAAVSLQGTCRYDPGRDWGPMEDSYPPEISNVYIDEGMITDVDTEYALESLSELISTIEVTIDDPEYDDIDINE